MRVEPPDPELDSGADRGLIVLMAAEAMTLAVVADLEQEHVTVNSATRSGMP